MDRFREGLPRAACLRDRSKFRRRTTTTALRFRISWPDPKQHARLVRGVGHRQPWSLLSAESRTLADGKMAISPVSCHADYPGNTNEVLRNRSNPGKSAVRVKQTKHAFFADFKFDPLNQCVWRGTVRLNLTPKAFAVFDHLIAHRSRLVTKEELLTQLWPDSYVSDSVLKVCVREIRKALDDDPAAPRFIETLHRRGYRFIAPIHESPGESPGQSPATHTPQMSLLVGREGAQTKLGTW